MALQMDNYSDCSRFSARRHGYRHSSRGTHHAESPILKSLHWLQVRQCVTFKLATLVHKCLTASHAPDYLADDCQLVSRRQTRSATAAFLELPRSTSFGNRKFGVDGPRTWNSLPYHIRDPSLSYAAFSRLLKWRHTSLDRQWRLRTTSSTRADVTH